VNGAEIVNHRFYLQALGITGLFIVLLIVIWIASGGPASEADVQHASSTRTAIAKTEVFLLRPFPTNTPTPLFNLSPFVPQTGAYGSTPTPSPQTSTQNPSTASSSTPPPTQTMIAQIPATATAIPFSHSQPTKAPPFPYTETSVQGPTEFIRWYFERVWKERDYQNLWDNYLTPSFKAHVGSGLFEDYAGWWDSVQQVDVNSVDVVENNGTNAWIRVNITLHMKNGHVLPNQVFDYDLLYDAGRNTWMFDYSP
jgi:serine/threonine-protein kinase